MNPYYDDLPPVAPKKTQDIPTAGLAYRSGRAINEAVGSTLRGVTRPLVEPVIEQAPKIARQAVSTVKDFGRGILGLPAAPAVANPAKDLGASRGRPPRSPATSASLPRQKPGGQAAATAGASSAAPVPPARGVTLPAPATTPGSGTQEALQGRPRNEAGASSAQQAGARFDLSNPFDAALISQNEPAYREYLASRGFELEGAGSLEWRCHPRQPAGHPQPGDPGCESTARLCTTKGHRWRFR